MFDKLYGTQIIRSKFKMFDRVVCQNKSILGKYSEEAGYSYGVVLDVGTTTQGNFIYLVQIGDQGIDLRIVPEEYVKDYYVYNGSSPGIGHSAGLCPYCGSGLTHIKKYGNQVFGQCTSCGAKGPSCETSSDAQYRWSSIPYRGLLSHIYAIGARDNLLRDNNLSDVSWVSETVNNMVDSW